MQVSSKSNYDDSTMKWLTIPEHKEVKAIFSHSTGLNFVNVNDQDTLSEGSESTFSKDEKKIDIEIIKEKFYEFLQALIKFPEYKINYCYLNQNLNIKIEKILDFTSITEIFEKLCLKFISSSRLKKNWSDEEATLFLWTTLHYCHIKQKNFTSLEDNDWTYISLITPGKNAEQCKYRWQSLLKITLSKVPWTQKEDELLISIIKQKGTKQWKHIAKELNAKSGLKHYRHGKQCRERWINHLDPTIIRGSWSIKEDIELLKLELKIGKKWAEIAKNLGTRTENAVKNRWNSLMKKYRNEFGMEEEFDITQNMLITSNNNHVIDDIESKIATMIIEIKEKKLNIEDDKSCNRQDEESLSTIKMNIQEEINTNKEDNSQQMVDKSEKVGLFFKKKTKKVTNVDKSKNLLKEFVNQEKKTQSNPSSQGANDGLNSSLSSNFLNIGPSNQINCLPFSLNTMNMHSFQPSINPLNGFPISTLDTNTFSSGSNGGIGIVGGATTVATGGNSNNQNGMLNPTIATSAANSFIGANFSCMNAQCQMSNMLNLNDVLGLNKLLMNSNNQIIPNTMMNNNNNNTQENMIVNQGISPNIEKNKVGMVFNQNYSSEMYNGNMNLTTMGNNLLNEDLLKKSMNGLEIERKPEENLGSRGNLYKEYEEKQRYINLRQIPYQEFKLNDNIMANNQAFYAVVDLSTNQLCYVAPINKETIHPTIMQSSPPGYPNMNLGLGCQFSSPYSQHPSSIFNSPLVLFNNNPSLGSFGKSGLPIRPINKEFNNMHLPKPNENSLNFSGNILAPKKENIGNNDNALEAESQKLFPNFIYADQELSNEMEYRVSDTNSINDKNLTKSIGNTKMI